MSFRGRITFTANPSSREFTLVSNFTPIIAGIAALASSALTPPVPYFIIFFAIISVEVPAVHNISAFLWLPQRPLPTFCSSFVQRVEYLDLFSLPTPHGRDTGLTYSGRPGAAQVQLFPCSRLHFQSLCSQSHCLSRYQLHPYCR